MSPSQRAAVLRLADALDDGTGLSSPAASAAALLRELAAEPTQDTPPQRPPTPVGWSDTDWLAHLSTMPPIAYALRDTLYGTSKAGVLRFCAANEPGAFAVYASPPQQREPGGADIETKDDQHDLHRRSVEIMSKALDYSARMTDAMERIAAAMPQQRKPLTDAQIKAIWWQCESNTRDHDPRHEWWSQFARAIERAHGITGEPT